MSRHLSHSWLASRKKRGRQSLVLLMVWGRRHDNDAGTVTCIAVAVGSGLNDGVEHRNRSARLLYSTGSDGSLGWRRWRADRVTTRLRAIASKYGRAIGSSRAAPALPSSARMRSSVQISSSPRKGTWSSAARRRAPLGPHPNPLPTNLRLVPGEGSYMKPCGNRHASTTFGL
jgi:hypothetical protein